MKINIATSERQYKECFEFIKNLWKDEFEIDFELNLEKQYQSFIKSNIYFIKENSKIIALIQLAKVKKWYKTKDWITPKEDCYFLWRIWVSKDFRTKWYWTELIKFWIEKIKKEWIKLIYLSSEINNINYYSKFWFKKISDKERKVWNTSAIYMKKEIQL